MFAADGDRGRLRGQLAEPPQRAAVLEVAGIGLLVEGAPRISSRDAYEIFTERHRRGSIIVTV